MRAGPECHPDGNLGHNYLVSQDMALSCTNFEGIQPAMADLKAENRLSDRPRVFAQVLS